MCAITQIEENNFSWQRSDSVTVILGNKKVDGLCNQML